MTTGRWMRRLEKWRGVGLVEENLAPYEEALQEINRRGEDFARKTDGQLREVAASLRERACGCATSDELLVEVFTLAREAAGRALGMRPFDVQVMAGVALSRGKLVEMQSRPPRRRMDGAYLPLPGSERRRRSGRHER